MEQVRIGPVIANNYDQSSNYGHNPIVGSIATPPLIACRRQRFSGHRRNGSTQVIITGGGSKSMSCRHAAPGSNETGFQPATGSADEFSGNHSRDSDEHCRHRELGERHRPVKVQSRQGQHGQRGRRNTRPPRVAARAHA